MTKKIDICAEAKAYAEAQERARERHAVLQHYGRPDLAGGAPEPEGTRVLMVDREGTPLDVTEDMSLEEYDADVVRLSWPESGATPQFKFGLYRDLNLEPGGRNYLPDTPNAARSCYEINPEDRWAPGSKTFTPAELAWLTGPEDTTPTPVDMPWTAVALLVLSAAVSIALGVAAVRWAMHALEVLAHG